MLILWLILVFNNQIEWRLPFPFKLFARFNYFCTKIDKPWVEAKITSRF